MKNFLKGAAVVAAIWIVLVVINVICNMNGHELDSVSSGTVAAVCAMLLDRGLTKKEKKAQREKELYRNFVAFFDFGLLQWLVLEQKNRCEAEARQTENRGRLVPGLTSPYRFCIIYLKNC